MPLDVGEITWVSSEGGPLILLAENHLLSWGGVIPPQEGRLAAATFRWAGANSPATDYDRACDINDVAGLVEVGTGHSLVLSEGDTPTGWWENSATRGMLVQGGYGEEETFILSAINKLPENVWKPTSLYMDVEGFPLYLFDAGLPGANVASSGDYVTFRLTVGSYSIASAEYKAECGSRVHLLS